MDILECEKGWLRDKDMAALTMMKSLEKEKQGNMKKRDIGRHTVRYTAGAEYKVETLEKQLS